MQTEGDTRRFLISASVPPPCTKHREAATACTGTSLSIILFILRAHFIFLQLKVLLAGMLPGLHAPVANFQLA